MKTILVDAVDCLISPEGDVFEGMHRLLETYPNRKIVVTGANDEQFKRFKLDTLPYEVFTLKHSPEKTDPEYFKILFTHFHLTADDVVYFEHNQTAVESAASLNINSFFYDNNMKDLVALKNFLDSAVG